MFELTNDQRKYFCLTPVSEHWERIEAKPSLYDLHTTHIYLDGDTIVKCILTGYSQYQEYELSEKISSDRKYLLPKTSRGKPVPLSAANIQKRKGIGMSLSYLNGIINLYNDKCDCSYFYNGYLNEQICDLNAFSQWVKNWCQETTEADKTDLLCFSQRERKHVRFSEGDVFRFKIDRRHYGYGRVLLDYDKMRKKKEPFWDILMSKPVVCSVYHIISERDDVLVDELKNLRSLPSTIIADNSLFYGEYEIIGNLPITENEDYPIMYGNSLHIGEDALYYQCGKTYRKLENITALKSFHNNGVSFSLNFNLNILLKCIEANSNDPYWTQYNTHWVNNDLRNPKNAAILKRIQQQVGI